MRGDRVVEVILREVHLAGAGNPGRDNRVRIIWIQGQVPVEVDRRLARVLCCEYGVRGCESVREERIGKGGVVSTVCWCRLQVRRGVYKVGKKGVIRPESDLNRVQLDWPFEERMFRYEWRENGYKGQGNGGVMHDSFDVAWLIRKCVGGAKHVLRDVQD